MTEAEQLKKEINELEAQIEPKRKRLTELCLKEHDEVEAKIKRTHLGKDKFKVKELIFAAYNRCPCGAGLAYPKGIGPWGSWDCSDILLGQAVPKDKPNSKQHTGELPFSFYEIKSEDQPSANGATTRERNKL